MKKLRHCHPMYTLAEIGTGMSRHHLLGSTVCNMSSL